MHRQSCCCTLPAIHPPEPLAPLPYSQNPLCHQHPNPHNHAHLALLPISWLGSIRGRRVRNTAHCARCTARGSTADCAGIADRRGRGLSRGGRGRKRGRIWIGGGSRNGRGFGGADKRARDGRINARRLLPRRGGARVHSGSPEACVCLNGEEARVAFRRGAGTRWRGGEADRRFGWRGLDSVYAFAAQLCVSTTKRGGG